MKKKKPKFLRRRWYSYGKLGKRRKTKQVWRRPSGRDNKMREKRRGYGSTVSIGYGSKKNECGMINGKKPIMIHNLEDLKRMNLKQEIALLGNVGKRKKIEIAKFAQEQKIEIKNLNPKRFLKLNDKQEGKKK